MVSFLHNFNYYCDLLSKLYHPLPLLTYRDFMAFVFDSKNSESWLGHWIPWRDSSAYKTTFRQCWSRNHHYGRLYLQKSMPIIFTPLQTWLVLHRYPALPQFFIKNYNIFKRSKYFFEYQISMTTFLWGTLKKLNAEYILGQDFDILTIANTWPRQDPNTWREHGNKKRQNWWNWYTKING